MGIVRDVTVDQLTQAVGNIDTSTLAQDSTLQDVATAIGNISGGSDPVTNTTVNSLCKDTTGQSIVSAITGLANAVKPDASDIPYDSNTTVKGKIDEINDKFVWEEQEFNITYTSSINPVATANVDISKRGYTPIGVISWGVFGTSSTLCFVTSLQVNPDNSTLYYAIRVRDNGTYSHFLRVRVLYLKN